MTKLIFEKTSDDLNRINLTDEKVSFDFINNKYLNAQTASILPDISELKAMRHYKEFSDKNFCIEKGLYNPNVNELSASLGGFTELHPLQDDTDPHGALELINIMLKTAGGVNNNPDLVYKGDR